ncbi:hypothetical protein TNCV_3493971 [Trichonephila clavipes]|nr:hypothetical protein TNCV_3493971 [Trichonephila clavipes]
MIDGLEKYLVLRAKNWENTSRKKAGLEEGFLRKLRPTLGCRATEEGRNFLWLMLQFQDDTDNFILQLDSASPQ